MTQDIDVTIPVTVTVDESKFTPDFIADFREHFYPFHTVDDHIRHIASLAAYGQLGDLPCLLRDMVHRKILGLKSP